MVFAAVGMTDGTRICPGEHNENMRDLTLWLTGLDHGFFGCFFSSEFFVVLFSLFLTKNPETPFTFPARREVTSCFVASLVKLMMFFLSQNMRPPKKTAGMTLALDTCVEILRVGKLRVSLGGQRHSWRKHTELGLYQNLVNGRSSLPTRFFELVLPVLLDFSETINCEFVAAVFAQENFVDHAQQQVNTWKNYENWHVHGYLLCIGAEMLQFFIRFPSINPPGPYGSCEIWVFVRASHMELVKCPLWKRR